MKWNEDEMYQNDQILGCRLGQRLNLWGKSNTGGTQGQELKLNKKHRIMNYKINQDTKRGRTTIILILISPTRRWLLKISLQGALWEQHTTRRVYFWRSFGYALWFMHRKKKKLVESCRISQLEDASDAVWQSVQHSFEAHSLQGADSPRDIFLMQQKNIFWPEKMDFYLDNNKKRPFSSDYEPRFSVRVQLSASAAFQEKFRPTVTRHQCQCHCLVSLASLSRRRSSACTPCPRSLQTPPCAYAPYGSSTDANFPPSACALYLHTEARSPLDSDRHPSPCLSAEISNVNLQPAGAESDPQPPCWGNSWMCSWWEDTEWIFILFPSFSPC